jgi:small subunit ribosomal protein S11
MSVSKVVKKKNKTVVSGIASINASFNNTMVTISDQFGNVLCWSSAGSLGFKGARKSTPYAAQRVSEEVGRKCQSDFGMKSIEIKVSGPGPGRDSAVRGLSAAGLSISLLKDCTPIPHNGCDGPGRRRS